MIKARRLGHLVLETPDIARQVDYFTQVMGLILLEQEKDRAFLGSKVGHLAVELVARRQAALHQAVIRGRAGDGFRGGRT